MNETPDVTPRTTRPAAPAATAHVIDTVRAEGAACAVGPNVAISHDAAPNPAAVPRQIGMNASTDAFAANRTGPHPWAWRNAASVRRPATANAAAAATTAVATPRPAMRSSRSGPSTVAVLRSTSRSTSGIDERNSVSRRPKKKEPNARPQHSKRRPNRVFRSVSCSSMRAAYALTSRASSTSSDGSSIGATQP